MAAEQTPADAPDPREAGPEGLESLILRCLSDGVLVIGAEGRVSLLNPRAEILLNVTFAEARGMLAPTFLELVLERTGADDQGAWLALAAREAAMPDEESSSLVTLRWPERRVLKRQSLPLRGGDGTRRGRLILYHDITQHHLADEVRDNIIAMVSHELRTPLTSIKAALRLVRESPGGEGSGDMLNIAMRNCDRLSGIVDSTLDLARFRSGKMRLSWERLDLAEAVGTALGQVADAANRAGARVEAAIPIGRFPVRGDRHRLEQVLVNLLDNAVAHAPRGSAIEVSAEAVGAPFPAGASRARNPWIRVAVSDRGPGVPQTDLSRVFEPFFQVGGEPALAREGLGLGLALCRSIIEEHQGRIWCERRAGGGSRFAFEIPGEPPPETAGRSAAPAVEDFPVLVVDDDPDLVEIIVVALARAGYRPLKAYSGPQALSVAEDNPVRAVILDIRMPGMSGYEVLRRLKEAPRHRDLPVLMLTASGEEGRAVARDLGAYACLTKPFEERHLLRELEDIRREGVV